MTVNITSTDPAEYVAELIKDSNADPKVEKTETSAAPEKAETESESATGEQLDKKDENLTTGERSEKADKRIGKITKEKSDAERERDYWKQVALEGKKPTTEKEPDKKPEKVAKEPNPDDFEKPTDYYKAVAKYEAEKMKETIKADLLAEQKTAKAEEVQKTVLTKWEATVAEARTRYKDYNEVTGREVPLDKDGIIQETFLTSEIGGDLAYWWGSHEEEAKALLSLTPVARAREVGKIEARVQAELDEASKKDDKSSDNTAQAKPKPKPITPVTGQGSGNVEPDEEKIPYREWADKRNSKLKRRY